MARGATLHSINLQVLLYFSRVLIIFRLKTAGLWVSYEGATVQNALDMVRHFLHFSSQIIPRVFSEAELWVYSYRITANARTVVRRRGLRRGGSVRRRGLPVVGNVQGKPRHFFWADFCIPRLSLGPASIHERSLKADPF